MIANVTPAAIAVLYRLTVYQAADRLAISVYSFHKLSTVHGCVFVHLTKVYQTQNAWKQLFLGMDCNSDAMYFLCIPLKAPLIIILVIAWGWMSSLTGTDMFSTVGCFQATRPPLCVLEQHAKAVLPVPASESKSQNVCS